MDQRTPHCRLGIRPWQKACKDDGILRKTDSGTRFVNTPQILAIDKVNLICEYFGCEHQKMEDK